MPEIRIDTIEFWVNLYALIASIIGIILSIRKWWHIWKTRHLRKIWGFKDGDSVIVVCSELDNPEERQHVEPREFIYSLKYGDVDAYFEVMLTLLRLYPSIKLRSMSSGEAETTRLDLSSHIVVIGGPDYNALTRRILSWGITQFEYRSPYVDVKPVQCPPDEIVIYDRLHDKEYCYLDDYHDYGYFERIINPYNPDKYIILIGGCHTIGVTGAIRAFSMAESREGEIPSTVLRNAEMVAKHIGKAKTFAVLVDVERIGQTISTPVIRREDITVRNNQPLA